MILTSEKDVMPLFFFELTDEIIDPYPGSYLYRYLCTYKSRKNYPAPNSKAH